MVKHHRRRSSAPSISSEDSPPSVDARKLALLARCTQCDCVGFRCAGKLDEAWSPTSDALKKLGPASKCSECSHTMKRHLDSVLNRPAEERTRVETLATGLEKLSAHISVEEKTNVKKAMEKVRRAMLESIQTDELSIEEALRKAFPRGKFQGPSIADVISYYVKKRPSQRSFLTFLKTVNELQLPAPEELAGSIERRTQYRLFFEHWLVWTHVPSLGIDGLTPPEHPVRTFGKDFFTLIRPMLAERLEQKLAEGNFPTVKRLLEFIEKFDEYLKSTPLLRRGTAAPIDYSAAPNVLSDDFSEEVASTESPVHGFEAELADEPGHDEELPLRLRSKRNGDRCALNGVTGGHREKGYTSSANATDNLDNGIEQEPSTSAATAAAD
ncbi:acetyltransferase, partial [Aphelenchoides avenae]